MKKYGIIFNSGNNCGIWIGVYENDTISKFSRDDTLIDYSTLPDTTFQLVMIDDITATIQNICVFSIDKPPTFLDNEVLEQPVVTVLENTQFPSHRSDNMFRGFLSKSVS